MTYEFENDFPLIIYNTNGDTLNGIKQTIDKLNELEYVCEKYERIINIMKVITTEALSYKGDIINVLLDLDIEEFDEYLLTYHNQNYENFIDDTTVHHDYEGE